MGELLDPASLPEVWVTIARHRDFPRAMSRLAANMLHCSDQDDRLGAVFKDAGRYIAAMSAAWLHGSGGLTLPMLKQICAASSMLSPGRAQAILEYLLHIDYLRAPADPATGKYLPTERFLSGWCRHLQAAIDAGVLIAPAIAPLSERLADRDTFAGYLAIQAARLHALARAQDPFPGLRRAFLHPYAGSQILWVLTLAAEGISPAGGDVRVSLSDMAGRFGVTHLHVRRLLKHAHEEGLLVYHGHGRVSFEPAGLDLIRYHYAAQLCEIIGSAQEMLAQTEIATAATIAA